MKKSLIFLSMCSAALLSSCGTSSYYAYSAFEDGIYYRPDKETRQELEADRQEVQGLIEKTRQEAARFSDTIMLASINGTNSITSTAAATATPVNINVDNWYEYNLLGYDTYCSYWDWKYWDMFGPWGRYSSWADWYNWYSPWFPGIYDPWYPSYGWTWSFAWNSWGWYGPWWGGYWGGWYDPWYGPWGYPVASQPVIHYGRRDTGTSLRTGTGLTGGRLTASAGSVRQTGNTVRSANTVRNAGNVRQTGTAVRNANTVRNAGTVHQAVTSDRTVASTVRPTVSVVRGNTATAQKVTSLKTTATRVSNTGTAVSVNSGRTTAVGNFKPVGHISSGNRYVQAGRTAVRAESLNRTAGQSYRATNSSYRRAATSTATSFRNPFEMRRGTATVSGSLNGTGFNRTATSTVRSNGYSRTDNTVFNRNTSSSRTFNNSSATRSVSRSSFSTGGSRSFTGGSRSSGGSVRSVRR